ncbi:type II toxin-antitoxin system death-on-curing family toxin [Fibrella arboris]|uniref:type II toxin-antitoxin system death-on-curing family toxin n=1 Tax=Fibrella arboris TaxID=3242486 RepID=UPI003521F16C
MANLIYLTVSDKAAVYCYSIIGNHIFSDGNKRTGLGAALMFLNLNKFDLSPSVDDPLLTDFILAVASGQSSLDECRAWFAAYIVALSERL